MKLDKFSAYTPNECGEWHSLKAHLSKVSRRAKSFAENFGAGDLAFYAGLWHDLGKYNPAFQYYLQQCAIASQSGEKEPRDRVPHAIYGAKLAAEKFGLIAPLIFGHHGGLPQNAHLRNRLEEVDVEVYRTALESATADGIKLEVESELAQQSMSLIQDSHSCELLLRLLFSCLVDADYMDTEAHFDSEKAAQRGSEITVPMLWKTLQSAQDQLVAAVDETPVNQVRSQVYQACKEAAMLKPGVFRLAVPTGGGKTRNGVLEYLVWQIYENQIDWFSLQDGEYILLQPDEAGIVRSLVFPGLWLAVEALRSGQMVPVLEGLQAGLRSTEHQAFVQSLTSCEVDSPRDEKEI